MYLFFVISFCKQSFHKYHVCDRTFLSISQEIFTVWIFAWMCWCMMMWIFSFADGKMWNFLKVFWGFSILLFKNHPYEGHGRMKTLSKQTLPWRFEMVFEFKFLMIKFIYHNLFDWDQRILEIFWGNFHGKCWSC